MSSKTEMICQQQIFPIIEALGYEIIEVEFAKKSDGMNLSFYIDSPKGILVEDCETVHRAIEDKLDEINISGDKPYTLNVCSPGLDRPIKNQKDFQRNRNKNVEIKLFKPLDGKKSYCGSLHDYTDLAVTILIDNEPHTFEHKLVAVINPIIEF